MQKLILLYLFTLVFAFTVDSTAQVNQNFTLVNKTGVTIYKLYVAPVTDSESWGPNLLGDRPLKNGDPIKITFDKSMFPNDCVWDLKVIDKEGTTLTWYDINFCKLQTIKIYWDSDEDTGWVEFD